MLAPCPVRYPDVYRAVEELVFRGIEVDIIVFEMLVSRQALIAAHRDAAATLDPNPHSSAPALRARFGTRDSGGVVSFSCCDGLVYLLGYTGSV
jgi:hypothetical protein